MSISQDSDEKLYCQNAVIMPESEFENKGGNALNAYYTLNSTVLKFSVIIFQTSFEALGRRHCRVAN